MVVRTRLNVTLHVQYIACHVEELNVSTKCTYWLAPN